MMNNNNNRQQQQQPNDRKNSLRTNKPIRNWNRNFNRNDRYRGHPGNTSLSLSNTSPNEEERTIIQTKKNENEKKIIYTILKKGKKKRVTPYLDARFDDFLQTQSLFSELRKKFGETEKYKDYSIYKEDNLELTLFLNGSSFCHQVSRQPLKDKGLEGTDIDSFDDMEILVELREKTKISNDLFPPKYMYDEILDITDIVFSWSKNISIVLSVKYQRQVNHHGNYASETTVRSFGFSNIRNTNEFWAEISVEATFFSDVSEVHRAVLFVRNVLENPPIVPKKKKNNQGGKKEKMNEPVTTYQDQEEEEKNHNNINDHLISDHHSDSKNHNNKNDHLISDHHSDSNHHNNINDHLISDHHSDSKNHGSNNDDSDSSGSDDNDDEEKKEKRKRMGS
jgi:hypothetical protein